MAYYVEIPYDRMPDLIFPATCPFTGVEPADKAFAIYGRTLHDSYSVPGVPGGLATGNSLIVRIPVAERFARLQRRLALVSAALIGLFFVSIGICWIVLGEGSFYCAAFLLAGAIGFGTRRFLNRRVWIDYVGDRFVEIAFARRGYAEEFAELNDLYVCWKLVNFRLVRR